MTIAIANTSNSSTFQFWLDRTNELADAMSNKVITVQSNTTSGNATVNGIFSATTLSANTLRGGNVTTTTVLTVSSNLNISGTKLSVGDNVYFTSTDVNVTNSSSNSTATINASSINLGNSTSNVVVNSSSIYVNNLLVVPSYSNSVTTTGTSSQLIDSFSLTTSSGAEYILYINDNSANSQQLSKILMLYYTNNSIINEYGVLYTNSQLGVFSANANNTHTKLYFTPTVSNSSIKFYRTVIN